jgi:hypothetical protein
MTDPFAQITEQVSRKYYHSVSGNQMPDEQFMLAKLLDEYVLSPGSQVVFDDVGGFGEETITLYIQCNDFFIPAADAESITLSELPTLFELYMSKKWDGVLEFIANKRKIPCISWREKFKNT